MAYNKMLFIGEKESFITRVLIKKAVEAGGECSFVPWNVNEISKQITDAVLILLFMEEGGRPGSDVMHYLMDTMFEKDLRMILVGEQNDLHDMLDAIPPELIYRTFPRPVDNAVFGKAIAEFFSKAAEGEFRKSILVVDDDPQYLTMVREWLKGTYKVAMANSGLQAIKWLGKNKVDLILLDHEMPVTSGPQVLEMLRSDPETSSIPVIFLTGKSDKKSVMAVVGLKPEGYFLKGIQREELLEKLGEFFALHN